MKTNPFTTIAAGITTLLTAPAFAIEAPEDNTPPPAAPARAEAAEKAREPEAAKPAEKEPIAFLGVLANEVPGMLAEHTGLEQGDGVIVRSVEPGGPADKAGLAVNDIITKLAGKPIGSAMDLTNEVRSHKPGEQIHLDIIHKGKAAGLDVTLGVRPDMGELGLNAQPLQGMKLDGVPQEMAERIRKALEGNLGGIQLDIEKGNPKQVEDAVDQMRKRMEKALEGMNAKIVPGVPNVEMRQQQTIIVPDGQGGTIELHSKDGSKEATVRDRDKNIVWSGPWETDQDKAAAPKDVRDRIDRLHIDSDFKDGFRIQLGGGFQLGGQGNLPPGNIAPENIDPGDNDPADEDPADN